MLTKPFPTLDAQATGANIAALRQAKGYTVRDLQEFFGFAEPQAIYKWQRGQSLPSVDNLYALSILLETPINDILISTEQGADFFMPTAILNEQFNDKPPRLCYTEVIIYRGGPSHESQRSFPLPK